MSDVLAIYFLIGGSHWAAHVLQCPKCHAVLQSNLDFVAEGVVSTFGWPIHLCSYLLNHFRRPTTGLTAEEVEATVSKRVQEIMAEADGGAFVELKQEEGESDDAFNARIKSTLTNVAEAAAQISKDRKEHHEP